jgi:hypothetical protein
MRKAIWAIGMILAVLALPSQAEEAQRFPPYPDVWGVELPGRDCAPGVAAISGICHNFAAMRAQA